MTVQTCSRRLPAAGACLALSVALLAGCADRPSERAQGPEATKSRLSSSTGYPFRPAPFYRITELDELTGPEGYTGGY